MAFLRLLYVSSGISIFMFLPEFHVKANSKTKFFFFLYVSKNCTLKTSKMSVRREGMVCNQRVIVKSSLKIRKHAL